MKKCEQPPHASADTASQQDRVFKWVKVLTVCVLVSVVVGCFACGGAT